TGVQTSALPIYKKETKEIETHLEEITKGHDWARYKKIPENAPEEQVKVINNHNATVKDYGEKFNSALWPQTAKERAEVAAAAVYSHVLNAQLVKVAASRAALDARVKALEKEN